VRVLVLGGEGMLGHKMVQVLRSRIPEVVCTIQGKREDGLYRQIDFLQDSTTIEHFNALGLGTVRECLKRVQPNVAVNCIGIVKQRKEAVSPIPSITLNSILPHLLAEALVSHGGRLIHFSTDCVFSGSRGQYTEDDASDAEDLYGKTKFLGEVTAPNALTLRTSIIGRELQHFQSLLEWFIAQRGKTVRGFTEHYYSGVTTNHLAQVVADLIVREPPLSGLYQVTAPVIAKHDLLCLLRDAYNLDLEIVPDATTRCDRSMVGDKFRKAAGYSGPAWEDLVSELASDPTPYDEWR
jgi:dTDP-4-dehydrorhamnose reductase